MLDGWIAEHNLMSIEIPELRLGWAPAVVRGSLRRTLIDFMTVFAVPRPTEPNVLRMRRLIWGMNAVAALCAVVGILVSGLSDLRGTYGYTFMVPSTTICMMLGRV